MNLSLLCRHFSIDESVVCSSIRLHGSSITWFLLLHHQSCDNHEVIREHSGSDQQLESLATLGKAAFHATAAEEYGDSPLDAGPEALTTLEAWTLLVRFLRWTFLPATLGNANKLNSGTFAFDNIGLAEKSPIRTVDVWRIPKCFLVTQQRRFDVDIIRWISIEYTVLSDQTLGAFRNVDLVPEFHRLQGLTSLDQVGMGFEDRKDLLFIRYLLSVKHAATCLINDSVPKITVMVDLLSKGLDRNFRHHVDATDPFGFLEYLARGSNYLLRGSDEFAIFRNLPLMPLFGRHSLDLLHSAPGAAISIGESLHAVRKQVVEISDQAGNDSHDVPQQGAIRWVVNVSFDNGRIDAQFLAVFQPESDGRLDDQVVDHLERRRGEPVKGPVESIMFGNELAVETRESPQSISVSDSFSQFAVIPVFHSLKDKRAQYLLCRKATSPGLGILQTTLKIPAHLVYQVSVPVNEIGDGLQHRLQAYTLVEEFQIGKADLGVQGSRHFLTF
jgi:hypothetical protein